MFSSCASWSTLKRRQPGSSFSEPSASCSMALRKRCRSVGLTRTFTQIASIGSPCSWSDGVDERAPGRGDLLRHGLGTGKRTIGLAIPVARVVQVALEGVHDAVQPRRQRGFLGLDDLVGFLPGPRFQKLQRLLECHGRDYTIAKEHRLGGDLGHARAANGKPLGPSPRALY